MAGADHPDIVPHVRGDSDRDTHRGIVRRTSTASVAFDIDRTLLPSTPLTHLLAVFDVLLARYSGQDDITVVVSGVRFSTRDGSVVDPIAVRTTLDGDLTIANLLQRVQQDVRLAADAGATPLDSASIPPRAMFAIDRVSGTSSATSRAGAELFDLVLAVRVERNRIRCRLECATRLFDQDFIDRCAGSYRLLLEQVARTPDAPVMSLPIVTAEYAERLRADRAGIIDEQAVSGSFLEWVEANVRAAPDRCAVEEEVGGRWTCADLWTAAGRVAGGLAQRGVNRGDLVGVRMARGAPMLAVLLGILRRGAAYLPLDPAFPAERLEYMVDNSGAVIVISDDNATYRAVSCVRPEELLGDEVAQHAHALLLPAADDLAYVLYTSGSTGRPKGVEITHGALRNFLGSMRIQPGLDRDDVFLAVTTLSFDIAGLELFLPLCVGARVVIASKDTAMDGRALIARMESNRVTVMQATPATWRMLIDAGWRGGLRSVLCGGEQLSADLARALVQRAGQVWNLYGPTETTIWSTIERIDGSEPILVGGPILNTRVYVLDAFGNIVPDGVRGEIWIAGAGVARGYRNRPDLTAERFRPDPFVPGERMYRTGDIGRWRSDGRLEHLGRSDFQVKIHGFRIELGEIERVLETFGEVHQAVVTVTGERDERRLVAYVIFEDGRTLSTREIRQRLAAVLPHYMVPGIIVQLDAFPLTPNGKVDRRALPAPLPSARHAYDPPRSTLETLIADAWCDVLHLERVGRHDDFLELGGHSLHALQVIGRLNTRGIDLSLHELMSGSDVARLAESARTHDRIESIPRQEPGSSIVPLAAQVAMWGQSQFEDMRSAFHLRLVLHLEGDLDRAALAAALARIVERHSVLRSCYPATDGVITVAIDPPYENVLEFEPGHTHESAHTRIRSWIDQPFDLGKGPLFRTLLLRITDHDHLLAIAMHHIVADGWSWSVLMRELSAFYHDCIDGSGEPLPPLPISFFDFASWQRARLDGTDIIARDLAYWAEKLRDAPVLELPASRPRPPVPSHRGDTVTFEIDAALLAALERVGRAGNATLFMMLLGVFQLLLARICRQDDVVIGIPDAGRRHRDVENLIGCFINVLPIRTSFDDDMTVNELVRRVRQNVIEAMEHASAPFDRIANEVVSARDMSRSPVFQALLSIQTIEELRADLCGLRATPLDVGRSAATYDLTLWMTEIGDGFHCELEYATDLFDREFIERCARSYLLLLEHAARAPSAPAMSLPIIDADSIARQTFERDPGKVEAALESFAEIRQAVVLAAGIAEDCRLVAYVIFEPGSELLASEIRNRLGTMLPQYMVPAMVVSMESFPLTPNGKVDREALPDPLASMIAVPHPEDDPPVGIHEETIARVWSDLLGVEQIGRHANFFELGGHSLLAVRASALIARECGLAIAPREFAFRTLAQLASSTPDDDHPDGPVATAAPTDTRRAGQGWRRLIRNLSP